MFWLYQTKVGRIQVLGCDFKLDRWATLVGWQCQPIKIDLLDFSYGLLEARLIPVENDANQDYQLPSGVMINQMMNLSMILFCWNVQHYRRILARLELQN